ncbi:hypothetical protein [Sporosarcina sp. FA9]|uniref:hypothetical protein n=1 Tax=Sporosarcina sp. FA9 TaxID=3413030 RepID=UPI003F657B99
MKSKYIDIALILFMGYFAYTRFANEQYGFATMFAVLCLLNIFTAVMKHKKAQENEKSNIN